MQTPGLQHEKQVKDKDTHVIGVSYEPGYITSKVNNGYGDVSWVFGSGFAIDYSYIKGTGHGAGLTYQHNATFYVFNGAEKPLKLDYAGVDYVWGSKLGKHWETNVAIGMGFAHYSISGLDRNVPYYWNTQKASATGFGFMTRIGIAYNVSQHIGIGCDLRDTRYIFPSEDSGEKGTIAGFNRLAMNIGLRFYF